MLVQNTYETILTSFKNYFETSPNVNDFYIKYPAFLQQVDEKYPLVSIYDNTHQLSLGGNADIFNFNLTIIDQSDQDIPSIITIRNNLIRIAKDFLNTYRNTLFTIGFQIDTSRGIEGNFITDLGSSVEHAECLNFNIRVATSIFEQNINPL